MIAKVENRVQLLGHLGQDVELRELAQGKKLARFSLATNEFIKGANGESQKTTTWHNLIAWGQLAENISGTLKKGSKVLVEGKISHRNYETKEGEKRQSTEIVVSSFRKLDREEKVA